MALGMRVLCYDPKIGKDIIDEAGVEICSRLVHVLQDSDYLSVHLTKRADTLNFLSETEFGQMKQGAYLLNYARGGIINEADLQKALDSGHLAGAALDVFDIEPPEEFNLIQHPRVVCTPHIGAASQESQDNVARIIAEQFIEMFNTGVIRNQVN
jgi:D-3-phosphoglycerate dehydrogenase